MNGRTECWDRREQINLLLIPVVIVWILLTVSVYVSLWAELLANLIWSKSEVYARAKWVFVCVCFTSITLGPSLLHLPPALFLPTKFVLISKRLSV